jgi:cytoskeletal protein RodZ
MPELPLASEQEEETTLAFVKQAVPAPPESTLQVNIVTIQKVALAAAIVSLIAVAVLIANSIFNPEAYNYQNQRQQATPTEIHSQPQVEKNLPEASASQQDQEQSADPNQPSSGQAQQSANADDSGVVPVVRHDK